MPNDVPYTSGKISQPKFERGFRIRRTQDINAVKWQRLGKNTQ